jgi:hypothetical protein
VSPRGAAILSAADACPACNARKAIILAIDAPPDELRRMDGRVELSADEAVVEFGALTLRQVLEPLMIEVAWSGDTVMQLVAGSSSGGDRVTLVDGVWTEALANVREELEARFGPVALGGVPSAARARGRGRRTTAAWSESCGSLTSTCPCPEGAAWARYQRSRCPGSEPAR